MTTLYSDPEYCKKELISAIKLMGDKRIMNNEDHRSGLLNGITNLYLNCPAELSVFALSVLNGFIRRVEIMFEGGL